MINSHRKLAENKLRLWDAKTTDSIFSNVNGLDHLDTNRRTSARIRQLEKNMVSELKSCKSNRKQEKSQLTHISGPDEDKVEIEFDTVDRKGERSRRKMFVSCSNQILKSNIPSQLEV
jgi:Spy/CpxP family protein refolding chaperone